MKTKYSRRTSVLSPGAKLVALVLGVCIALLLLLRLVFPDLLIALTTPFHNLGTAFSNATASFESAGTLRSERDELRNTVETLTQENATLQARLADIDETILEGEGVLAGVIARPPESPYDMLVVGRGMQDGVVVGARVFAKGVPIGSVEEVGAHTARVALFSTPDRVTEGWVGDDRLPLSLVGEGSGAFISLVPRETPITHGATVYLPGPGAIPVGTVYSIESHPSSPKAKLIISPLINPFTITWVRIAP